MNPSASVVYTAAVCGRDDSVMGWSCLGVAYVPETIGFDRRQSNPFFPPVRALAYRNSTREAKLLQATFLITYYRTGAADSEETAVVDGSTGPGETKLTSHSGGQHVA
jgi:hypothetical protein